MNERKDHIHNLLWKEVANKSPAASFAFSAMGAIVIYYYFNLQTYKTWLQITSALVLLSNAFRFTIAKKIISEAKLDSAKVLILKFSIWLNSLSWGIIFTLSALELNSSGFDYSVMLAMMVGYLTASILTLGYHKTIFFPFLILNLIPVAAVTAYQYYSASNPNAIYLLYLFVIMLLYLLKQYREYRDQLLQKFQYQYDLERALKEVKRSQETFMQETAKLLHTSKISALSDMAGGLAHEVNNSLQIILGSQQQIQRDLNKNEKNSPYVQEKFELMDRSIKKISEVIMGLKYFSQEMEKPEKDTVSLRTIIDRSLSYTFEMLKAHNVEVTMGEIPDINVFAHQFQITQIIFNLIKNADDAMSKNDVKKLQINFLVKEGFIFIRFIDNGRGISTENQSRLFQPFFSTKDINLGTGLSLSISRGIALDHGGDLFFDSYEKNTTFVLKLPIK